MKGSNWMPARKILGADKGRPTRRELSSSRLATDADRTNPVGHEHLQASSPVRAAILKAILVAMPPRKP